MRGLGSRAPQMDSAFSDMCGEGGGVAKQRFPTLFTGRVL